MTDTPSPGAATAAPEKSRTPSILMTALIVLGLGALGLLTLIVWLLHADAKMSSTAITQLSVVAQGLLSLLTMIGGYFFGASLKQSPPLPPVQP